MNSREYWRRREAAQLEKNITEEAAYDAALQKIYSTMLDSIDSNIRSFYSRYATSEGITLAEAKRRADKLDIEEYARKAARYVETKDFSEQANEEMKLYNMTMKVNRLELLKANIGAEMTAGYNDIEKMMGDALTKRTLEEIERQAGILGITINNNADLANSIVNASFHNATWSDRVWASQEELHAKVAQNLTKGLIQGVNSRTLASNLIPLIQDDVKNKRAAAERLMRTELARVQIDAQKRSYIEGGYDEYEIICDFQACHICKPYDGKHYPVDKMEIGENAPPFHPNCRCSTAVYESEECLEAWLDSGAQENGVPYEIFSQLWREYADDSKSRRVVIDEDYDMEKGENEIAGAKLLNRYFRGQINVKTNRNDRLSPDYEWNGKLWELKTPESTNGVDKLVHHALKQVGTGNGGVLLDCSNENIDLRKALNDATRRLVRSSKGEKKYLVTVKNKKIVSISESK